MADGRDGSLVGLNMHLRLPGAIMRALAGQIGPFLCERGCAGLELVKDGVANLCLLPPASVVAGIGSGWNPLRDFLTATVPGLARRSTGAAPPVGKAVRRRLLPPAALLTADHPGPRLCFTGDRLAHTRPSPATGWPSPSLPPSRRPGTFVGGGAPAAYWPTCGIGRRLPYGWPTPFPGSARTGWEAWCRSASRGALHGCCRRLSGGRGYRWWTELALPTTPPPHRSVTTRGWQAVEESEAPSPIPV